MIGPELDFTPRGLYIGGEWQEADGGGHLASINPSIGEHLGEVPAATGADVDRAVRAGRKAFDSEWGRMPIRERAGSLERLADRLHAHRGELGLMDCVDSGNALAGMVGDVDWTVDTLRFFAGLVTEIKGETSSYGPRHLNFTRRQPYGVVAKINPFNHPFRFCAEKAAVKGMNMNRQGQSCSSTSRVFVHESLHDAVLDALVAEVEALPVGFPWEEDKELGPIVSRRQFDRVMGFIASGREQGARLVTGGGRPADPALANGFFVSPTVFDGVDDSMRIAREEIFGPVMSVLTWSDYGDMLAKANGLPYGLTAAIVTNDLDRAMETAERVEAGYVWINSTGRYIGAPYGGWKQSGVGREECFEELLSYTRIKNVNLRW